MDFLKAPIDKVVYFVAGVIPGFAAILIYNAASPSPLERFFSLGFLGYGTKVGILLFVSFVVGNCMTEFLNSCLNAVAGGVGTYVGTTRPYKSPHTVTYAPWRDKIWRAAVKRYLGQDAPPDTLLLSSELCELRRKNAELQDSPAREQALMALDLEKLEHEIDDSRWADWYQTFHSIVLRPPDWEFVSHLYWGLAINFEATGLYVLVSAIIVPQVRHWWCIIPSAVWVAKLLLRTVFELKDALDKNSTVSKQVVYLLELDRRRGRIS